MRKVIGPFSIEVIQGNIANQQVDAIVNAANSDLWMGSGVAGAIKRRGGLEIEKEAMAKGSINPGEAVITSGGNLSAKYVIHCAGMPPGKPAKQEYVRLSVEAAFQLASSYQIESIAIPSIGAGVGGLTLKESIDAIIEAILSSSTKPNSIRRINLVAYSRDAFDSMKQIIDKMEDSE